MEERFNFEKMAEHFDKYSFYTDGKIERDIENNRKGPFIIEITDSGGNPVKNAFVKVKQISHEFNFGCSLFLLNELGCDTKNEQYKEYFKKAFNYAVIPLYWDALEPEKGKPRFSSDSKKIYRRPPVDTAVGFCRENGIRMKGHCLMYHSFNPDWIPDNHRELKILVDKRLREIGERYGNDFTDVDVINELYSKYKCLYGEAEKIRKFPIADEKDHVNWCFSEAKKYFPFSRLFWNEGCYEVFGQPAYTGDKSWYYLMLDKYLKEGAAIEGIGMQFHAFGLESDNKLIYNAVRQLDLLETYSKLDLPIHISEVSIPSYSNEKADEEMQAMLLKRLLSLWFSQKNVNSVIWWNLVDGTAYGDENKFHAGLLRNDMTPKPAFKVWNELVNKTWRTEFSHECKNGNKISFNGFYGDYEIEVTANGKTVKKELSLTKDGTGYHNQISYNNAMYSDCGLRSKKIIID